MAQALAEGQGVAIVAAVNSERHHRVKEDQQAWANRSIGSRLRVLKEARHLLAERTRKFCEAIPEELARTPAETRIAEIAPLLEACRFLEREAEAILAPRRLGRRGLPLWLGGIDAEIHRIPLGRVLIIAPSNYPLMLAGAQALQALAAGNAAVWKPGRGGANIARLAAGALYDAGLPAGLLRVTGESVEAAQREIAEGVDKVFFTGSAGVGRTVLRHCAERLIPSVMELSGCDAVIVLPTADLRRVAKAVAFGMRLNGSETCMAPRRLLLVDGDDRSEEKLIGLLLKAFEQVGQVKLQPIVREQLRELLSDAQSGGAKVLGDIETEMVRPIVVRGASKEMRLVQSDIFAPVISILRVAGNVGVREAQRACPFALTVSIFGRDKEAREFAAQSECGSVLVNDLIAPTADPRVPFGGRRQSGFGVTRGREGLLEMTAVKVVSVRRSKSERHLEPTTREHEAFFDAMIMALHGRDLRARWSGVKGLLEAARGLRKISEGRDE